MRPLRSPGLGSRVNGGRLDPSAGAIAAFRAQRPLRPKPAMGKTGPGPPLSPDTLLLKRAVNYKNQHSTLHSDWQGFAFLLFCFSFYLLLILPELNTVLSLCVLSSVSLFIAWLFILFHFLRVLTARLFTEYMHKWMYKDAELTYPTSGWVNCLNGKLNKSPLGGNES